MPVACGDLYHGRDNWKVEYEDMIFTVRCNDNITWAGIIVMGLVNGQKEGYSVSEPVYDGKEINLGDFEEKTFTKDDVSNSIRGRMTYDVMKNLDISEDIQHVGYTPEACGYEK